MICQRCQKDVKDRLYATIEGLCPLCEMLVLAAPPVVVTDDTRFSGFQKCGGGQFVSQAAREFYLGEARKAGVDVTGKMYMSGLAAYPGDPRAWVDSQGDMRRVLEERNWGSDGDLKVKCKPVEPTKGPGLAEDIVEDLVEDRLAREYGEDFDQVSGKAVEHAREDVINAHSPPDHWKE